MKTGNIDRNNSIMSKEIHCIKIHSNLVFIALCKYLPKVIVFDVEKYCNGFVNCGVLFDDVFKLRNFKELNYISYQIRYMYNLYFFDFWCVEDFNWGGDYYSRNWIITHYSYIYKNGTLLRDKVKFIIDSQQGDISYFNPSYPIYNLLKLKEEHFVEFECSYKWIQSINQFNIFKFKNNNNTQIDINPLFKLFTNLTENRSELFYENHHPFNL